MEPHPTAFLRGALATPAAACPFVSATLVATEGLLGASALASLPHATLVGGLLCIDSFVLLAAPYMLFPLLLPRPFADGLPKLRCLYSRATLG